MASFDKVKEFAPAKKAATMLEEFRNFALKGSVVDLAIGVIIGAAFSGIIKSLVDNIIMPLVSFIMPSEQSYQSWAIVLGNKAIPYGRFLADVINFLILAFALYLFIVKFLGWMMRTKQAAPPPPSKEEVLLTEIRDLLKQQARPQTS